MSLFNRRKGKTDAGLGPDLSEDETVSAAAGVVGDPEAEAAAAADAPAKAVASETFDRTDGPYDESEVDEDDARLALGGLRLAGREGMELRFEVEEATQRVIAVTIGMNGSTVQLQTFAAPRSAGVWDEIREEIAAAVVAQGGTSEEQDGPLGRELLCRLPVRTEDGRTAHQPTRFAGIDGPRWFLRAVFSGHAGHDAAAAAELEAVVRDVVVVRGGEAMAPRELIPLTLPPQPEQPAADGEAGVEVEGAPGQNGGREELKPFERGPEITEVR